AAALKRVMNSLRKSRFLARRSRKANMPARRSVSLAERSRRRRPPTKPSTAWNSRFLALLRAAPFVARIDSLSIPQQDAATAMIAADRAGRPGPVSRVESSKTEPGVGAAAAVGNSGRRVDRSGRRGCPGLGGALGQCREPGRRDGVGLRSYVRVHGPAQP